MKGKIQQRVINLLLCLCMICVTASNVFAVTGDEPSCKEETREVIDWSVTNKDGYKFIASNEKETVQSLDVDNDKTGVLKKAPANNINSELQVPNLEDGQIWKGKQVKYLGDSVYEITIKFTGKTFTKKYTENNQVKYEYNVNPIKEGTTSVLTDTIGEGFSIVKGPTTNVSGSNVETSGSQVKWSVPWDKQPLYDKGVVGTLTYQVKLNDGAKVNTIYQTGNLLANIEAHNYNTYYYTHEVINHDQTVLISWNNRSSEKEDYRGVNSITINSHEFKGTSEIKSGINYDGINYRASNIQGGGILAWRAEIAPGGQSHLRTYYILVFDANGKLLYKLDNEDGVPVDNNGGNDKEGLKFTVIEIVDEGKIIENRNPSAIDAQEIGQIRLTQKDIKDLLEVDKTADLVNWDERKYNVKITASSKLEVAEEKPIDVVLALDVSGSMLFPSKLSKVSNNEYTKDGLSKAFGDNKFDRNGTYYVINDPAGKATVYRIKFYKNQWHITDSSVQGEGSTIISNNNYLSDNGKYYVYTASDSTQRFQYVKGAASTFVKSLNQLSKDSYVGIVPFAKTVQQEYSLRKVDGNVSNFISEINQLSTTGGTNQVAALNKAKAMLDSSKNKENPKYVILLTDGSINADRLDNNDIKQAADTLKAAGYTLVTLGVSLGDIQTAKDLLQAIASKMVSGNKLAYELAYGTEYPDELNSIFNSIVSSVMGSSLTECVIKDYIDPRFNLLNDEGQIAKVGDSVNGGIVDKDSNGWYVIWKNQTIGNKIGDTPGWEKNITLVAKEDFLGGNVIPTNGEGSHVSVPFGDKDGNINNWQDMNLPKPTVNVKELEGIEKEVEQTYFLGETINTKELLKVLINELNTTHEQATAIAKELLENGKTVADYSYGDTNDVVGQLKLAISTENGNLNNHVATKVGNHVEKYQLNVKYIPKDYSSRKDVMSKKGYEMPNQTFVKDGGMLVTKEFNLLTGTAWVNVIDGKIMITKTIDKSTNNGTQGDPIFTFKIEGITASGKAYLEYRTVRFSNVGEQTVTLNGLEKGVYTITELDTMRYKLLDITVDGSAPVAKTDSNAKVAIGYTGMDNEKTNLNAIQGNVVFKNSLENDKFISDTDVVTNKFSVDENGKVTITNEYYNNNN